MIKSLESRFHRKRVPGNRTGSWKWFFGSRPTCNKYRGHTYMIWLYQFINLTRCKTLKKITEWWPIVRSWRFEFWFWDGKSPFVSLGETDKCKNNISVIQRIIYLYFREVQIYYVCICFLVAIASLDSGLKKIMPGNLLILFFQKAFSWVFSKRKSLTVPGLPVQDRQQE